MVTENRLSNLNRASGLAPTSDSEPIRVLVVDDSALMRKLISEMIANTPGLEVAGTARDGVDALEKARLLKPSVITLDVEMPNMNGIECLEALMREQPTPVVMVSSLTATGAETTIACLQRGAFDFVLKPSGSISLNIAQCEAEITAKVRAAAAAPLRLLRRNAPPAVKSASGAAAPTANPPKPSGPLSASADRLPNIAASQTPASGGNAALPKRTQPLDDRTILVAVASSTGGPGALQELLTRLPADLNAAYLIVQHLPPGFTRSLADRLNGQCALAVREAEAGDAPARGLVLMAPGGRHLELDASGHIVFNDDPPLWGVRPAADVMMRAVSARFGSRALGVILTGMGRDGALGAKAIAQAGGLCLAQDEATSIVYGMPRAAAETGHVARIVPLPDMAAVLAAQIRAAGTNDITHRAA